jgi:AmmeMemoRadiSam system protein A
MAATPSTRLEPESRQRLLQTASAAIEAALARAGATEPSLEGLPADLLVQRASFVTLTAGPELRGCCGTLEARRPLAADVWRNAQASAFEDPRFPPLTRQEWTCVSVEVSVLSPLERIEAPSEDALVRHLVPGYDGLVIAWRGTRATFLPKVWQQIDDPREFVLRLKRKAGWSDHFWAADLEAWRYHTEQVSAEAP